MYNLMLKLNTLLTKFLKLVYINLLWMISIFVGLIIFTIGPATYSAMDLIQKLFFSKDEISVTKEYFSGMRKHYKEGVVVSLIYMVIGYLIIIDFIFLSNTFLKVLFFGLGILYLISVLFYIPVSNNLEIKGISKKISTAFIVGFGNFHYTSVMLIALFGMNWLILKIFPSIFFLIGGSLNLLVITWFSYQIFNRIKIEQNK